MVKKLSFLIFLLLVSVCLEARPVSAWKPYNYPEEISKVLKYRFGGKDTLLGLDRKSLYSNTVLRNFYKGRNYQPLWITSQDYYKRRLRWYLWVLQNMKYDGYKIKPYHRLHTEITMKDFDPLITFSELADLEVYMTADLHYLVTHYPSVFWAKKTRKFLSDARVNEDYLKTALPSGIVYHDPFK